MKCRDFEILLGPYLDDELDVAHALGVERHIEECANCAAALDAQRELRRAIREHASYYSAPADLRRRVAPRPRLAPWIALAAACLVGCLILWRVVPAGGGVSCGPQPQSASAPSAARPSARRCSFIVSILP